MGDMVRAFQARSLGLAFSLVVVMLGPAAAHFASGPADGPEPAKPPTVETPGNESPQPAESSEGSSSDSSSTTANRSSDPPRSDTLVTVAPSVLSDQDSALDAVRTHRALPFERIAEAVQQESAGRIIDARLVELRGFLLYEVKVIEASGMVTNLYYYAKSGLPVR